MHRSCSGICERSDLLGLEQHSRKQHREGHDCRHQEASGASAGDQQGPTSGRLGVETSAISGYDRTTIDRMRLMRIGEESGLPGPVWGGRRGGLIRG